MLKFFIWAALLLSLACLICSCASSDQQKQPDHNYPNQVELQKPGNIAHQPGKVYIDSVSHIRSKSQEGLLITGSFADGCTQLQKITHSTVDDLLRIRLSAWKNTDTLCTQALVPFSYIYNKLRPEYLSGYSKITINGKIYSI